MAGATISGLRPAKAPVLVLVCGKCSRKLGPGGKAIRKRLKQALKSRRWGKVRLVTTRCLSICPKHRLVLASARTLAERRVVVIEETFYVEETLDYLIERIAVV